MKIEKLITNEGIKYTVTYFTPLEFKAFVSAMLLTNPQIKDKIKW